MWIPIILDYQYSMYVITEFSSLRRSLWFYFSRLRRTEFMLNKQLQLAQTERNSKAHYSQKIKVLQLLTIVSSAI